MGFRGCRVSLDLKVTRKRGIERKSRIVKKKRIGRDTVIINIDTTETISYRLQGGGKIGC